MGAFLDKPLTDKTTHAGAGNDITYGLSSMQGWRTEMEDAHTAETAIPALPGSSFFAVYDGHGGKTVSTEIAHRMLPAVLETAVFREGDKSPKCLGDALFAGFIDMDNDLKSSNPRLTNGSDHSGSTAIALLLTPEHHIFANCGDSRAVLARNDEVAFATKDHKPTNPEETARVRHAGGFVEMGRVCGNLAVSRALGDFQYKDSPALPPEQQKITAAPDISQFPRNPEDQFVVLACDGVWDVMSNQQVVKFVSDHLKAGKAPELICELLLDHCLAKNSKDNMSVIIIALPNAPKPVPGFQVPAFGDDEEDRERKQAEMQDALQLQQRVAMMLTGDVNGLQMHDDDAASADSPSNASS